MDDQKLSTTSQGPPEAAQSNRIVRFARCVKRYFEKRRAEKVRESVTDRAARRTANAMCAVAVFAFVLLCVGIAQYSALHSTGEKIEQQIKALNRQLDLMAVEQRAWIKVEIEPAGPLQFFDIPSPWGSLPLRTNVTNVGKSPAFNVRETLQPFLVVSRTKNDIAAAHRRRCEMLRDAKPENDRGVVVFPGERVPLEFMGASTGIGITPNVLNEGLFEDNGTQKIDLWFFGCVGYREGEAKTYRQTAFIYRVGHIQAQSGLMPGLNFSIEPKGMIEGIKLYPMSDMGAPTN